MGMEHCWPVCVWSLGLVGVWRSANEYRGKAIWSTLAKVVVTIGTMRAILLLDGELSLLF